MAGYPPPFYEEGYSFDSSREHRSNHRSTSGPRVQHPRRMATYNFPPPPPPPGPPPSNYPQQNPQYGYGQPPQHQGPPRGGGPRGGGRGGIQGGRGDFHGASPFQQANGYNGPPQQQGPPQGQGPPVGYSPQNPYLIGPQAPGPQGQGQGPQGGYSGPQWQDQHHPQQHGPPQHGPPQNGPPHQQTLMQQPPQPAPLSAQNYHPNYAPQAYQPPQYGPQQPPQQFQGPPLHQPPYGHSGPQGGPQQWSGPPQQAPQQFNNRGRGRGGFNNGRGGHQAPLMGPPIRMGFGENERDQMAQAGNGFPQPYSNHHSPTGAPFSQPTYQGFPPNDFSQRPPLDQNPFYASQRGRGNQNFRGRGRGDFQFRGRDNRHHNVGQRSSSDSFHKPAGAEAGGKKKKKRRTNTLGLTPNGVDHEDSEDEIDDVDEEARLVTLLGPDTPLLPTDLSAWLAERKSKYPTKARREAAAEELRQRREQGQNGKVKKENQDKPIKKEENETKLERQQRKAEKLRAELEKAERKIQDSMSGSKRKRETGDEGDDDRGQASEEDSEESSDSDSDSSKPETLSSRNASRHISQPPKAQLQRHCKYFSTGGTCGKKGKCRFVHDQEVRDQALRDKEANGGKMTLAQRLILNDTAKDDLTILKSIKYLKEKGLLSDPHPASASANGDGGNSEENGYTNMEYGEGL